MRSGKRNPPWRLHQIDRAMRCRWSDAQACIGPWTTWSHPVDPLRRRALHIAWRECGNGGGDDVVCTNADFRAAMEAIQCPP